MKAGKILTISRRNCNDVNSVTLDNSPRRNAETEIKPRQRNSPLDERQYLEAMLSTRRTISVTNHHRANKSTNGLKSPEHGILNNQIQKHRPTAPRKKR